MKASSATSGKATDAAPTTARSSGKRHSPTSGDSFALAGPSNPPDSATNAYRRDLADVALAGRVIASHYARPADRVFTSAATLHRKPSDDADAICELSPGAPFRLMEESLGWAWGYAGSAGLVGYVNADAIRQ